MFHQPSQECFTTWSVCLTQRFLISVSRISWRASRSWPLQHDTTSTLLIRLMAPPRHPPTKGKQATQLCAGTDGSHGTMFVARFGSISIGWAQCGRLLNQLCQIMSLRVFRVSWSIRENRNLLLYWLLLKHIGVKKKVTFVLSQFNCSTSLYYLCSYLFGKDTEGNVNRVMNFTGNPSWPSPSLPLGSRTFNTILQRFQSNTGDIWTLYLS